MNPETRIQNSIIKYLKKRKALVWRISDNYLMAGFPDLLVCYRGKFIALEVKTDEGSPSKQQEMIIDYINQAEGVARIVRSVQDTRKILDEVNRVQDSLKTISTTGSR